MHGLLEIEVTTKALAGVLLLLIPAGPIRLFGLARAPGGFWPRFAGALLLGLAAAAYAEGRAVPAVPGPGLRVLALVNLACAAALAGLLLAGAAAPTRRGRFTLWLGTFALAFTGIAEFAVLGSATPVPSHSAHAEFLLEAGR